LATDGRPLLTLAEAALVRTLREDAARLRAELQALQDGFETLREPNE
jgi:hypothetical protein